MAILALEPSRAEAKARWRYQAQDSTQTLAEGLAEYYVANRDKVLRPEALPPGSRALFRSHDLCHVIFGLDTTLQDEAMADTRTLLSCDIGWARYSLYLASDPQAKANFKQVGYFAAVWGTLSALPRMLRAVYEARLTRQRWPWEPPAAFLDRSLADLRGEFNIRVI